MAQPAAAQNGNAQNVQTIAAPLHFTGNDSQGSAEITPKDFLRQLEIRILGNRITEDADKLAFALNALQGKAHEWYLSLKQRNDYVETFEYFKTHFCNQFRVPGYLPQEFDISLIAKQKMDEDPALYFARISMYMANSVPAERFVNFTRTITEQCNAMVT